MEAREDTLERRLRDRLLERSHREEAAGRRLLRLTSCGGSKLTCCSLERCRGVRTSTLARGVSLPRRGRSVLLCWRSRSSCSSTASLGRAIIGLAPRDWDTMGCSQIASSTNFAAFRCEGQCCPWRKSHPDHCTSSPLGDRKPRSTSMARSCS